LIILPKEIRSLQSLLQPNDKYYLVGGTVRDAYLSRQSRDIDIVCSGDTRPIARNLANRLNGSFFMLDEERNTCRVILKSKEYNKLIVDFSVLRGNSIEEDLHERDFTINAMAVDLRAPEKIIDPLSGERDLSEKTLRVCKPTSFLDDPLRVFRAARYSVEYDLEMEAQTKAFLHQAKSLLKKVSPERKRDELFKTLDNKTPWVSLQMFSQFDLLGSLSLGGIPNLERALARVRVLDGYFRGQKSDEIDLSERFNLIDGLVKNLTNLVLRDYFNLPNESDRTMKGLDKLAALIWDLDEIHGQIIARDLKLSSEEHRHIIRLLSNKNYLFNLINSKEKLDARSIYRFYKQMGQSGIDLVVLAVIAKAVALSEIHDENGWLKILQVGQELIDAWYEHPEWISPKPYLSGRDILQEFNMTPGPLIGTLLDGLQEEQAAGALCSRQDALEWVQRHLH